MPVQAPDELSETTYRDQVLAASQRAGRSHPRLLRFGIPAFLVALDLVALVVAVAATGAPGRGDVLLLGLVLALYAAGGMYRCRLSLSVLDDAPALAGRALTAAALATSADLLLTRSAADASLVATGAVLAVVVPAVRAAGYVYVRAMRARESAAHPTLILGCGRVAGQLARVLTDHPEYGLRPIGFLDDEPLLSRDERPVPVLGGTDRLVQVVRDFQVRNVVVAFGSAREREIVDVIRTCDRLECEIFFVPRLFELHTTSHDMDQVWGVPLVRLRRAAFRSPVWRLKRGLDVVVSGAALVLLAPLLLACALAVRIEGGRGILFRQERVGLDGRPFDLLKFRSLKPVDESESQTNWNISHDDRLGPVGRFLRQTSLDELPQLWNILRGDMTLVGPRPERPYFVKTFQEKFPRYTARHRVPAGLTGWAQIHGLRGDTSIEDRARFDNYYIENWSLWNDVKILLRTVSAVLRRSGG